MKAHRRIHRKLTVEELEPRIAPATLTINGTSGDDAFVLSDNGNPTDGMAQIIVNGGAPVVFGLGDDLTINGGDGDDMLTVDFDGENPVPLSKGEYALLLAFLEAPQRPLTREHLLQATRIHEDIFDRSIDVQVLRLRRKLEADPSAPRVIQTERGVGYVFAIPVEPF